MGVLRSIKGKRSVFIIDDSPVYRELLKNEVKKFSNADIHTFASAEDCFKSNATEPELVILDLYLDDGSKTVMSGHEALRKLLVKNEDLKVILISAEMNESLLQDYRLYRGIDFILKSEHLTKDLATVLKKSY